MSSPSPELSIGLTTPVPTHELGEARSSLLVNQAHVLNMAGVAVRSLVGPHHEHALGERISEDPYKTLLAVDGLFVVTTLADASDAPDVPFDPVVLAEMSAASRLRLPVFTQKDSRRRDDLPFQSAEGINTKEILGDLVTSGRLQIGRSMDQIKEILTRRREVLGPPSQLVRE